jgi:hypothetical protein
MKGRTSAGSIPVKVSVRLRPDPRGHQDRSKVSSTCASEGADNPNETSGGHDLPEPDSSTGALIGRGSPGGQGEHHIGERDTGEASENLHDDVADSLAGSHFAANHGNRGHRRIEMGTADRPQCPNEDSEGKHGGDHVEDEDDREIG